MVFGFNENVGIECFIFCVYWCGSLLPRRHCHSTILERLISCSWRLPQQVDETIVSKPDDNMAQPFFQVSKCIDNHMVVYVVPSLLVRSCVVDSAAVLYDETYSIFAKMSTPVLCVFTYLCICDWGFDITSQCGSVGIKFVVMPPTSITTAKWVMIAATVMPI